LRNRLAVGGLALLATFLVIALDPALIAPFDPYFFPSDISNLSPQPPTAIHPFGTDQLGRDLLSRVAFGTQVSLLAAFGVVAAAVVIGSFVGIASASLSGFWDELIMRFADAFLAFPALVMAIVLIAYLGPGLQNAVIALSVIWWPQYARLSRGSALALLRTPFIESARAVGASNLRILRRHVLPNVLSPIVVKATVDAAFVILLTGGLSFLGLGAQPPLAELGALVSQGREYLLTAWWYSTFPGFAIFLIVLSLNFVGDGLREALDPTMVR
jgi:peptide/nickel transport system permease protein